MPLEEAESFCRERKINLSQTKNQSPEIDFQICGRKKEGQIGFVILSFISTYAP